MLETKLDKPVQDYKLAGSNFALALIEVASNFEIPMGIEWIEPAKPQRIALSWGKTTVRQVIESVVRTQPGYDWDMSSDMVHVFYKGAREDKTNFLNVRLDRFDVRNQYVAMSLWELHRTVNAKVLPSAPRDWFGHTMADPDDRRVNIEFRGATVREILDRLTPIGGRPIWSVTFREGAGLTPGGFRRTMTLWNKKPISDAAQPVWDRSEWGRSLPPILPQK